MKKTPRKAAMAAVGIGLASALTIGAAVPAFAAGNGIDPSVNQHRTDAPNGSTARDPLGNYWVGGVALTIHNETGKAFTVDDLTTDDYPQTLVQPGSSTLAYGTRTDNHGSSINFATARINTDRGSFFAEGLNGAVRCPSFVLDDHTGSRAWSAGGFWVDEVKSSKSISGYTFTVKRASDGQPGDENAKNLHLTVRNG